MTFLVDLDILLIEAQNPCDSNHPGLYSRPYSCASILHGLLSRSYNELSRLSLCQVLLIGDSLDHKEKKQFLSMVTVIESYSHNQLVVFFFICVCNSTLASQRVKIIKIKIRKFVFLPPLFPLSDSLASHFYKSV